MKISEQDVEYVAKLAMLEIQGHEKKALAEQLSRIVEYVDKLNELDLSGIEPTPQVVTSVKHALRDDRVAPELEARMRAGQSSCSKSRKSLPNDEPEKYNGGQTRRALQKSGSYSHRGHQKRLRGNRSRGQRCSRVYLAMPRTRPR